MTASPTKAPPSDPVTAHLSRDFTRLAEKQTVGDALQWLRAHPPTGRILYLYVVDDDDRLTGVVPTRQLLFAKPETTIGEIMVRQVITLPADASIKIASEFFIEHRLLAFPVVDANGRILGLVDAELFSDKISDLSDIDARNDLFQSVGVYLAKGQQMSPLYAFRRRFPWLGANLAAGLLAAFLSGVFEAELNKVVALAFFIPVVLNLAESVGSQSVSLALAALHGDQPSWRSLVGRLRREFVTGLMLGLAAGAIVALTALAWLGLGRVALCLLGGIAGGVGASAVLGLAMPVALRLLRLEPRVAAGPVALAGADVITILIYLNLARWLIG
ncbi:MAG: magnesium transporter [Gemmataceae bacterium]